MNDCVGKPLSVGDTIEIIVGIPGRDVKAEIKMIRGRLFAANEEGQMPLADCLETYNCTKVD